MKEVSATDAARGFADLLDAVQHRGETFVIRRNGEVVARIEPAQGVDGASVKRLLMTLPRDRAWADDLRELRASLPAEVPDWHG
jgi:antitoxin (DNA-binding transcriptional repressor) of toxin-antitoxin stability system